jgi:cytidylate kinase
MNAHYDDVLADIRARDARDSGRDVAPLQPASDAIRLDTSELSPTETVAEALRLVEERLARAEP